MGKVDGFFKETRRPPKRIRKGSVPSRPDFAKNLVSNNSITVKGNVMTSSLCVFVFSFNRGIFLENCLHSIEQCLTGVKTVIFDDNSTDPDTRERLSKISERHEVIRPNASGNEVKTGGLYSNMNHAIEYALSNSLSRVIFIQDDMQFVRRLTKEDFEAYDKYFEFHNNSIQISTTFVRRLSADTFLQDHYISKEGQAYIRRSESERGKSNFSAVGVFDVNRVVDIFGNFEIGEGLNSQKARSLSLVCGRAIFPDMCWLPYPPSFRGKKRNMKHRFFEYFGKSGFYPIQIMTCDQEEKFLARDANELPIMERFLIASNAPRHDIWSTGGGEYNLVCYGGWISQFYTSLRRFKKNVYDKKL